ncbi:MAG: DUF1217 domain-containing protein [Rhodobacteraceae bacterium]|nr:DUF1217 domain-containing protein [Paracoccaceae bacterium]
MFQPIIPLGGVAGWEFLKRTQVRQEQSFVNSPAIRQTAAAFRQSFGKIGSVDALVENRQALSVVLGAFGLQGDLDNRAFIRKVISDGVTERGALANRLADKRYLALAQEMSHLAQGGSGKAPTGLAESLIRKYQASEFEIAVGNSNESMRLALAFARKLPELTEGLRSETARLFQILGDPPTRKVLETALGLPKEFAALDIDEQAKRLQQATKKRFGVDSIRQLATPEMIETVTQRYLLMDQLRNTQSGMTGAAVALTLLAGSQ